MTTTRFDTVLVANRGEIAVRVIATLRRLGIRAVAVYSDADEDARHVAEADTAVRLGPAPAAESYLSVDKIIDAARATGAQAIHPGYGFLSENPALPAACEAAGLVFIGPGSAAIETMGDKIAAKTAVEANGVPVVPGIAEPGLTDAQLIDAAAEVGFPLLIKPSAGGGGKGMHPVHDPAELPDALARARREARAAFGDDTLFLERLITRPRHIEVQILADAHGTVIHLGERECSLQRRHQKVIEEAPSPLLDEATRARMGASACDTARSVDYRGAGTVEFLVSADAPDEFFFMEMNTRLQVEHPVTEMVTGIDLVEQQIRIAEGHPMALTQDEVALTGHAVEARIYAEDPGRGFLPTGGAVAAVFEPAGAGVRIDSSLRAGTVVGSDYDPMLAKVIAHADTRAEALARLDGALADTAAPGVTDNIEFVRFLLADRRVQAGDLDTALLDTRAAEFVPAPAPDDVLIAAGLLRQLRIGEERAERGDDGGFGAITGWRLGAPAPVRSVLGSRDRRAAVTVTGDPRTGPCTAVLTADQTEAEAQAGADAAVPDRAEETAAALEVTARATLTGHLLTVTLGGTRTTMRAAVGADGALWLGDRRGMWRIEAADPVRTRRAAAAADGQIRSPMPGSVLEVLAADGAEVTAGDPVLVVEAMKMEHTLTAPIDGTATVSVAAGDQVAVDQVLAEITAAETTEDADGENAAADAQKGTAQ